MNRFAVSRLTIVTGLGSLLVAYFSFQACSPGFPQGENLYQNYCATCHMEQGEGLRGLYPPVADSDYLLNNRAQLPCIIRHGMSGPIQVNGKTYDQEMVAIPDLNETEIHNILNYILRTWYTDQVYFTPKEVKEALQNCQ